MARFLSLLIGFGWLIASQAGAASFTDPKSHLALNYDDSVWEVVPLKVSDSETLLNLQRKTADKEGDTTYFSRVSVVKDDLTKLKKVIASKLPRLQAYQSHAVEFLKGQRFDVLSTEVKNTEAVPGGMFEIIANQRDFGLTYQQMGFIQGETAYLITATVRTKKFPDYRTELNQLFQSVKIEK